MATLLFPVIAWYDIIPCNGRNGRKKLLFPVIAWYDIIYNFGYSKYYSCCSQLSLGMI